MLWRFTITDRNNVATVIDEPVGWDSFVFEIKRDLNWHGIFFTKQGETQFEFHDKAMRLLKAEYEQYGSEGDMTLTVEEDCGIGYGVPIVQKLLFSKFEYYCGDSCYVKIPVETSSEVMELRNRINQKVNLETAVAFDETTPLPVYEALGYDLLLPSKGILLQNKAESEVSTKTEVLGVNNPSQAGDGAGMIEIPMKQLIAEIGGFYTYESIGYTEIGTNATGNFDAIYYGGRTWLNTQIISPIVNYAADFPAWRQINSVIDTHIHFSGTITNLLPDLFSTVGIQEAKIFFLRLPGSKSGSVLSDYELIAVQDVYAYADGPLKTYRSFSFSYDNAAFVLNENDRLYFTMTVSIQKHYTQYEHNAFSIEFDSGAYFKMKTLSHTPATLTKAFMVNEVISRIAESITNNKVKAYSEYYGRTDSKPYSHVADGCGSLKSITDGLRIRRQENKIPDKPSFFSVSLQDVFDGLSPVDNIGMGLEADTNRPSFKRLRTEPWKFFYNENVVMSCIGIEKIVRKAEAKEIFSTFQIGYSKWEAEEYNGLDEFITKRSFRTTLSQIKNDLVKLSNFIASGYAWEITRRKGNDDSKDWRYDKNTFIVCCKRDTRSYSLTLAGDFLNTVFYTHTDPSLILPGDKVTITGSSLNNGTYTIDFISDFGGGGNWGVYFKEAVTPENGVTITVSRVVPVCMVELGNITNPANIIDPATIYNYRITPARNAMRWMNNVVRSYRQFNDDAKILFTDGEGNYYAEGQMTSAVCRQEAATVAENATINRAVFADPDKAKPFLMPERVLYDFPMTSREYNMIEANPNGLIYFESDCDSGYGWIDTISYKPEEGTASFNLIPKAL